MAGTQWRTVGRPSGQKDLSVLQKLAPGGRNFQGGGPQVRAELQVIIEKALTVERCGGGVYEEADGVSHPDTCGLLHQPTAHYRYYDVFRCRKGHKGGPYRSYLSNRPRYQILLSGTYRGGVSGSERSPRENTVKPVLKADVVAQVKQRE